jgi:biopolymer transport protein ExbD
MNLSKHDPETEMEMNMTPMIDVVFLLIIFFMIITDLTQKDLEDLELPMVKHAVEDKPPPGEWRPIMNIKFNGEIIVTRTTYYDPEVDDSKTEPYHEVAQWLNAAADKMEKEEGTGLPDEALLIRADMSTPFKHIQNVLELCAIEGVKIWKIQLAASVPNETKESN